MRDRAYLREIQHRDDASLSARFEPHRHPGGRFHATVADRQPRVRAGVSRLVARSPLQSRS